MNEETRNLLNAIAVYAEIMNTVNDKFDQLIQENTKMEFQQVERKFYELASELMRVLPISKIKDEVLLDKKSGILKLKKQIDFIYTDYKKIVDNEVYNKILADILILRNKFMHEPHNIGAAIYVGGKTSCSICVYHKDTLYSFSTIKFTNIIYDLNEIFSKLKNIFLTMVDELDESYKEYPCYESMMSYQFERFKLKYSKLPMYYLIDKTIEFEEK